MSEKQLGLDQTKVSDIEVVITEEYVCWKWKWKCDLQLEGYFECCSHSQLLIPSVRTQFSFTLS